MKRESALKAELMKLLRAQLPSFVHQRHEDRFAYGWPDISITGNRRTSFWEIKHATPQFSSTGIQELTMLRLAATSYHARYIFYHEKHGIKQTLIVHPQNIVDLKAETSCAGFDQAWLVEQIRKVHSETSIDR